MAKELYDIAEIPPLGEVPAKMHAWTIRPERFGPPTEAFQPEVIDVPEVGDDDALVYVMAAGVNYNNVWAGLGIPVNVIAARNKAGEPEEFHIGGSDASGIVYKVGKNVSNVKVGDEVVVHCGTWDVHSPDVKAGLDPMYDPSFRIWGYETNYGSFAQFTLVQAHQLAPKPKHLTWEGAAAYMLVGATAYRMLMGWKEHELREGDPVLIWGGAGGLGSMAIQIAKAKGAIPIAVVSSDDKFEYCMSLGAKGCINRKNFDHWGMLPHWKDNVGYREWLKGARAFGKAIWDVLGEKRNPRVVFEHPGESTIPTSIFVCDTGGIVTICAGTTGYNATVDLRYLWMRQKRLQGSHFANDEQSYALNNLVVEGLVDPCLSKGFRYDELPLAHQMMYENRHPHGNMSILIGAKEFGMGKSTDIPEAAGPSAASAHGGQRPPALGLSNPSLGYSREELDEEPEGIAITDATTVADLMHPGVITCRPEATVAEVVDKMTSSGIHAIIVAQPDCEALGVISQTDLVLARQGRTAEETRDLTAADVMTPGYVSCTPDTPLTKAITTMTRYRIHRLLVVEEKDGRNIAKGVLSMTDVVRATLK